MHAQGLMRTIFMFLLICSALTLHAQGHFYYAPVMSDSAIRVNHITEINIFTTRMRPNSKSYHFRRILYYDRDGKNVFQATVYDTLKQQQIWYSGAHVFGANLKQPAVSSYHDYNDYGTIITDFNADSKPVVKRYFNKKGKLSRAYHYIYADSLLMRQNCYNKRNHLSSYYNYEYRDGKLFSSAFYSGSGKLKKYWNYACDDAGKAVSKQKDTFSICTTSKLNADGSRVVTTQSFDYRGEPVRYVQHFDPRNRVIKHLTYYGKNEILGFREDLVFKGSLHVSSYRMHADRQGKKMYSITKFYNGEGMIQSQHDSDFRKKNTSVEVFTFEYNTEGLISLKSGTRNGKFSGSERYVYRFRREE